MLTQRDRARLSGCHPQIVAALDKVFAAMAALGFPMTVTDGNRTVEQQQALYAKGRPGGPPGPRVTNADGVRARSNHQGGCAADCCFLVDGRPSWEDELPWGAYGEAAKAVGLRWGGDWKSFRDRPHVEVPKHLRPA